MRGRMKPIALGQASRIPRPPTPACGPGATWVESSGTFSPPMNPARLRHPEGSRAGLFCWGLGTGGWGQAPAQFSGGACPARFRLTHEASQAAPDYNKSMHRRLPQPPVPSPLLAAIALALITSPASAQIATEDTPSAGPRYGEAQTIRFRVGAEITASRGACRNIVAMVAVPLECPEQQVQILDEDFSPEVGEVTYRMLQDGARQMMISVPFLPIRRHGPRRGHGRSYHAPDPAAGEDRRLENPQAHSPQAADRTSTAARTSKSSTSGSAR